MRLNYLTLVNINFFILTLVSFILPPLFPKKIFFSIVLLLFIFRLLYKKELKLPILNPLLLISFMFIYMFVGGFGSIDIGFAMQFCTATLMLLLFYVVIHFEISINKHIQVSAIIFVLIVYYISLSYFGILSNLPYSQVLVDAFIHFNLGFIGERNFGGIILPMLHFVSSPVLLILVASLIIDNQHKIGVRLYSLIALAMGAVYFSGSRGIFVFTILCFFTLVFFFGSMRRRLILLITLALIGIYVVSVIDFSLIFNSKEQSNSIKLEHVYSYFNHADIKSVLFGEGLAANYYTSGFDRFASMTELMIFDFFRYFGVLNTIAFFIILIFPVYFRRGHWVFILPFKNNEARPYLIAFLFYLMMAMTNPMLLNSYGMIVVVWYWSNLYRLTNHH